MFVAFFTLFITSCATEDTIVENGSGVLSITLGGVNDQETIVRSGKVESQTVDSKEIELKDGLIVSCEMKENVSSTKKSTTPMTTGITYRIVVLDGSNNVVATKDYAAGSISPFSLPVGTYTVVAYSFNNSNPLPTATSPLVVPSGADLLYFSQASVVVTSGATTPINIVFDHKFSEVEIVADAHALILNKTKADLGEVVTTGAATLDKNYGVSLNVLNGSLIMDAATTPANFTWSGSNKRLTSPMQYIYSNGETPTITVSSITLGGNTFGNLPFAFSTVMSPGKKYTFILKFRKYCTLSAGTGKWLTFMCHNLGADYTVDPDNMAQTDAWKLNGANIQWGKRGPSGNSRDIWQTASNDGPNGFAAAPTDGTSLAGANQDVISGWSSALGTGWNINTDADPKKNTATDPCPEGWRVPSQTEWTMVIDNNPATYSTGSWTTSSTLQTNYNAGIHLGTAGTATYLTLPAPGKRASSTGVLLSRGTRGYYWSSSSAPVKNHLTFTLNSVSYNGGENKLGGLSVRCVAEYENTDNL